jgi:hypothetical protein
MSSPFKWGDLQPHMWTTGDLGSTLRLFFAARCWPEARTQESLVTLAQIHRYRHHAALKAAGDKLLKVRERRDDVAHLLATPKGPNSFSLKAMAGSKSKPFIEKIFTVDDLDQWCAKLRAHSMEIDSRVTEITGWSWTHISEEFGVEI